MIYQAYQNHMDLTAPWRSGAAAALKYLNLVPQGVSDKLFGRLAASLELISRSSLTYHRPAYGIDRVLVGNQELEVTEEVTFATPFGSLLHFKKENAPEQPRLLLVAPMSGHFATLLRGTVKTLLQDHDVYITDWHNPRDIPLQAGRFGLEDPARETIEGRPPPQPQRDAKSVSSVTQSPLTSQRPSSPDVSVEGGGVELIIADPEHVTAGGALDRRLTPGPARQMPAQRRDRVTYLRFRGRRRSFVPQQRGQALGADLAIGVQEQGCECAPLAGPANVQRVIAGSHLDRPQDAVPHLIALTQSK